MARLIARFSASSPRVLLDGSGPVYLEPPKLSEWPEVNWTPDRAAIRVDLDTLTRTVAAAKNAITAACREHSTPFTVRYASEVVESDDSLDAEIVVSFWAHAEDGKPALITRRRVPAGE